MYHVRDGTYYVGYIAHQLDPVIASQMYIIKIIKYCFYNMNKDILNEMIS